MAYLREMKIVILDGYTTNPGDLSWAELEKLGRVEVYDWTEPEDVLTRLQTATAAFTNKVCIEAKHMEKLPDLKYIGIMATGTDCVDLGAAAKNGIIVTNIPTYANYSVSQLTFALILELCYGIDKHRRSVTEEKAWCRQKYNSYWLQRLIGLNGRTIGVIGMGKIGERVADIACSFGMKVLAYDVMHRELPGVEWVPLERLLRESDIVSVHCPLVKSTYGLINKQTLSLMKKTAFFINTSRGPLVNDQDLADALNRESIAGAGLDVLGEEPPSPENPLLSAKNVIITPHIGWATLEARTKLIKEVALNFEAFINGENRNVVGLNLSAV